MGSDGSLNANWNYLAKAGVSDLTNKGGLLVGDGTGTSIQLNPGASGYVRLAMVASPERMAEACRRLKQLK